MGNPADEVIKVTEKELKMAPMVNQAALLTILHFQQELIRKERGWWYRLWNSKAKTTREFEKVFERKSQFVMNNAEKTV